LYSHRLQAGETHTEHQLNNLKKLSKPMALNFSANQTLVGFYANNNNNYCAGFSLAAIFNTKQTSPFVPGNLNLNTLPPLLNLTEQGNNVITAQYTQALCTYMAIQAVQNDTNLYVTDRARFLLASVMLGNCTRMSFPSAVCTAVEQISPNTYITVNVYNTALQPALQNTCNQLAALVGALDAGAIIQAERDQINNTINEVVVQDVQANYTTLPNAGSYDLIVVNDAKHMIAADYNSIYDPADGITYTTIVFNNNGTITGTDANNNTQLWAPSGLWIRLT
jgi:hypothetical protein